ncbi:hypothetical protein [Marininema halotolerans]|uniref:HhH-GPD superfamily base excision DNA repair protein n=1 Tax=Marininema halotolerans TaxID=1155944 RepID=A0A1I6UTP4_9BACL|nr:hypothetical protein [Marininema halotolerans]SFT04776.1 HhH-GPD superfamily base excision DNA repair protein [Marininema halotolerans]
MKTGEWKNLYARLSMWKLIGSIDDWWGRTDRYEKIWGSILVQNTSWNHAARALDTMREQKMILPKDILQSDERMLQECVRVAGFYLNCAENTPTSTK